MAGKNTKKPEDLGFKAIEAVCAVEKTKRKVSNIMDRSKEMKTAASLLRSRAYLNRTRLIEFKEELKNSFLPARGSLKETSHITASNITNEAARSKLKKELKELSKKSFRKG